MGFDFCYGDRGVYFLVSSLSGTLLFDGLISFVITFCYLVHLGCASSFILILIFF